MSYKVELTENFKKEAKMLISKYASLREELRELGETLAKNPTMGVPLGNNVYKSGFQLLQKEKAKGWCQNYLFCESY